jgi:hypothetical protein
MRQILKVTLLLFGCFSLGSGQTREATIDFILREIKSYDSRSFSIEEASFSQEGDIFRLRTRVVGFPDRTLEIPLKNVNIFARKIRRTDGLESYNLRVRCRGRDASILVNTLSYRGCENIIGRIEDRRQAEALERAFAHLTELTTGRKDLFTGR